MMTSKPTLWRWLIETYGEGGKLHREIYYSDFGAWVRSMNPERRAEILSITRSIAILAIIFAAAVCVIIAIALKLLGFY